MVPAPPTATFTAGLTPVAGTTGAGNWADEDVMEIAVIGMVLEPLDSGVVAWPVIRTWPALLRTSTGKTTGADAVKVGAPPLQLTGLFTPLVAAVGTAGMDALVVKLTVSMVPLAAGPCRTLRQ